jgi:hypothetical protein
MLMAINRVTQTAIVREILMFFISFLENAGDEWTTAACRPLPLGTAERRSRIPQKGWWRILTSHTPRSGSSVVKNFRQELWTGERGFGRTPFPRKTLRTTAGPEGCPGRKAGNKACIRRRV